MAQDYRVLLGVDLKVGDIRKRIGEYNKNTNNAKVKLGVKLDTKGISNQIRAINSKTPVKIDVKLNTKNVQSQINNIKRQIEQLGNIKINLGGVGTGRSSNSSNVNNAKNDAKEMNWAYRQMLDIQKKANSLSLKINGLDASKNVNELKELSLQFARLRSDYEVLKKTFGSELTTIQWGNLQAEITETDAKLAAMDAKFADTKAKLANGIKTNISSNVTRDIHRAHSEFNKLSNQSDTLRQKLDALDDIKIDLDTAAANNDVDTLISRYEIYKQLLKDINAELAINKTNQQNAASAAALEQSKSKLSLDMDSWLKENSAAAKQFGGKIRELQAQIKNCDSTTLTHLRAQFTNIKKEAQLAGKNTQTLGDRLKTQFSKYTSYLSVASIFTYTWQGLRDMFNQVVAIDSAMTELKKVTDETDDSYNKFLSNAASRSKELGTTIDGLVESTADFARLGYGFKESQGLAEVANIYAVVGDEIEGVEDATKSLISTLAAYKDETSKISNEDFAMDIVDKFNEVSNNFAISSGGIGEAMQRSASSLRAANNTIDESIALITAANTVVQDPVVIGTSFKTISMRIRGAKTELEEAGLETDGMVESTAKLRQEILALSGVDIMENNDTFKSTYQIMDELAKKWKDLTDIQQASITELIAGKRQGNVISSLMQNFDIARDALETSLNSEGSAMAEHAKWSQSLEARLNKLKSTWQSLSQSFMSSDFLKGALDAVIGLVNGIDKLIDSVGTLPTLLGIFAGGRSLFANKGFFTFDKETQSIQLLGNGLTGLKDKYAKIRTAVNTYNSNLSKSTGLQNSYINALSKQNSGLGKYLSGLNSAKASFPGYIASLVGATIKTFALEAATIALNAALTMGISFLISAAIKALDKWIETSGELAERIDEVTSKYKEQHNELTKLKGDYDTSNESSMISKYEKLSKGVDNLGKNVSLTSEEYSEYQGIVNQIAEQIPSLISGYDSQGNALLSCKGNVEELTAAYEKLIHAQNQEILTRTGDIEKDFANTVEKTKASFWSKSTTMTTPTIEGLEKALSEGWTAKEIEDWFENSGKYEMPSSQLWKAFEDAGIGDLGNFYTHEDVAETLAETLEEDPTKIKGIIDNYYAQFADAVEEQKTIAQAKLSEAFDISSAISGLNYGNIGENLQAVARQTVGSLDWDFLSNLSEQGKSIEQWTTEMLNQLNAISKADNAQIDAAFELQTKFNGGDISYGEYVRNLKDVESTIDKLNLKDTAKNQLKISLGLDDEGIVDQYEALVKRLTDTKNYDFDISEDQARKLLDGLSSEELSIAVGVITDMSNNDYHETAEEIKTAIERELSVQGLSLDVTVEKAKVNAEALTTAITESFSGSGLSNDSISAVEGVFGDLTSYDASKLFERTANGIRLNSTELKKLNDERKNTDISKINKEMDSLGGIYNQTREELYRLAYGTDEYNAKLNELNGIERQINDLEKLAAGVEGVTSAFQEWQMVESAGNERDMYESVIGGIETMADEISRGWLDDSTIELLELLTGRTDLATMSAKELKKVYKGLDKDIKYTTHSIRDFFTVDEDGNSTSKGVFNFLDAVGQMEEEMFGGKDVVKRDKNHKVIGFDFQLVGGNEVIAEALGVSEELVEIMVRAADDAGFVVSMDGTYQQLDVLREKAQEASESLNKVLEKNGKKGFDFNFNTSDVKDIQKQLTEAQKILDTFRNSDGTINTKLEGADEALTVASTLQSMLDKLSRPTYMKLETNQVEDEIQEPLKNLQQLRTLAEQEHQLKLSGADTSKLEESKQEIYKYFEELDPEIKAELGLVDKKGNPLTGDALKEKLNSGEITIDATVDIQMEMDEKLGILVDKALLDAGIIDEKEFNKRVKVYLEADVDNTDAKEKTDNAVKEVAEGGGKSSSKDGKSSDNKKVEVKTDVEIKAATVDTSDVNEKVDNKFNEPPTGAEGRKMGMGVDVEVTADKVDTSDVKDKTKEAVEGESSEKTKVEKEVELEVSVDEYQELIQNLEDVNKDITIDVTIKGIKDVKELNKSIDLAAKIKGDIDKLEKFADGAKKLQGLDTYINKNVVANIESNLGDNKDSVDKLEKFADGAKALRGIDTFTNKTVEANIESNLGDNEADVNLLGKFADDAKRLKDLDTNTNKSVTANFYSNLSDDETSSNLLTQFVDDAKKLQELNTTINKTVTANIESNLNENKGDINLLGEFADDAKKLKELDTTTNKSVKVGFDSNIGDNKSDVELLGKFADNAKKLKSLDTTINKSVKVSFESDIWSKKSDIDNLGAFADNAKKLKGLDTTTNKSVKVALDANIGDKTRIDNLGKFADNAKKLKGLDTTLNKSVSINLSGKINKDILDNLNKFATDAKQLKGLDTTTNKSVKITLEGNIDNSIDDLISFANGAKALQGVKSSEVSVIANVDGTLSSWSGSLDQLAIFAQNAKALQGVESSNVSVTANISGNLDSATLSNLSTFNSLVGTLSTHPSVTVSVKASVDFDTINNAIKLLRDVSASGVFKDYKASVNVGATVSSIDDTVVQDYKAPKKDGKVSYSVDSESSVFTWTAPPKDGVVNYEAKVDPLTDSQKHKTGTITYRAKLSGVPVVNGTAHANGTSGKAFAQGNWGIKGSGVALGGEMGTELVVRNGRWFTVGEDGAQFFRYKKDDIVFNAAQTASLFKYGGIKGANPRGKMLASGTAFAEGAAFAGASGSGGGGYSGGQSYKAGTNTNTGKTYRKNTSDAADEFEEIIDLIEIAIKRIERSIDNLDREANNIYKSWSIRNNALSKQISEVQKEIDLQQNAANEYLKAANGVGLSSEWVKKVQKGEVDIESVTDEVLKEKIDDYQTYYEKYLDCIDAVEELKETEASLYQQRFKNVQTQYDGILQGYEHTETMLNEYISQAEAKGQIVSKNYYNALIENEKQNINTLKQEQAALIAKRDEAVDSGKIKKGSEAWYEMCAEIDGVTQAIEASNTKVIEFGNSIRDINWEVFDLIQQRISDVTAESDFLIELMSNKKLYDDNGRLTEQGAATMGLHGLNYNTHMYQADEYGKEIAKIDKQLAKGYSKELEERRRELIELQRESILAAEDEKNAIRDMVEEGINLELDAMQELIDKKNEALESERDLYEYQKKVKEQTEEIASLEKQMAAYENDNSEEAKAKIQELRVSLSEAEDELKETEYDKFISDSAALLDELYLEYETILNTRLDNVDALLEGIIDGINAAAGADGSLTSALGSEGAIALALGANAATIGETLKTETDKVGTTLSQAMNNIWNTGEGNAKSVLTMYGEGFQNKQTTTNTELSSIKLGVNSLVSATNKEAEKKVAANKTSTSAKKDPTKTTTTTTPSKTTVTTNKSSAGGDGKAKVGDKVKFVSGQYYYDSQGKKPLGYHNRGKYVYITKVNDAKWATHPYHISTGNKLGKGDLGWLKLNQLSGYASGKKNFSNNEYAWTQENGKEFIVRPSDGAILTPIAKGDSVLTSTASDNIWNFANSPAEFIKDNLNLGAANVPNNSTVQSVTQHLDKVVFNLPNVKNYEQLLAEMQKDKSFEKLIMAMTVDRLAGGSSLAKGKAIR